MSLKLTLENFQNHRRTVIEIEGITFVIGPTHNGKSSIRRAVQTLFYGRSGYDYIKDDAEECHITLESDEFKIIRSRDKAEARYFINGQIYEKLGIKGHIELLAPLGIKELLIHGKTLRLNVVKQREELFVVDSSAPESFSLLSSLIDGNKLSDVLKLIKADCKELSNKQQFLLGSIETNKKILESTEKELQHLASYLPAFNSTLSKANLTDTCIINLRETQIKYANATNIIYKLLTENIRLSRFKFKNLRASMHLYDTLRNIKVCNDKLDSALLDKACMHDRLNKFVFKNMRSELNLLDKLMSVSITIDAKNKSIEVASRHIGLQVIVDTLSALPKIRAKFEYLAALRLKARNLLSYEMNIKLHNEKQESLNSQLSQLLLDKKTLNAQLTHCPYCSSELTDKTKDILLSNKD
jgi:hypothetical protein